jgi:hypothetical protein
MNAPRDGYGCGPVEAHVNTEMNLQSLKRREFLDQLIDCQVLMNSDIWSYQNKFNVCSHIGSWTAY